MSEHRLSFSQSPCSTYPERLEQMTGKTERQLSLAIKDYSCKGDLAPNLSGNGRNGHRFPRR